MLVFFLHGTAVRNPGYSDRTQNFILQEFSQRGEIEIPSFGAAFFGDILGADELWDWVLQDLENFKWDHPGVDLETIFSYQNFREQLISKIFGDIFTYLNPDYGHAARKTIAVQLLQFIKENPGDDDLHLVAHSLGSVILWDILFSDKLSPSDPAFYIRDIIKGLSGYRQGRKVYLRTVTTMGSPLLFFNRMLGIAPEKLKIFAQRYVKNPLRWINIINAGDIFAYPLASSQNLHDNSIFFQDKYLEDKDIIKRSLGDVAMALGLVDDHTIYWKRQRVANLITANLLGDISILSQDNVLPGFGSIWE